VCIQCGEVDFAVEVRCGIQDGERVVILVIARRAGRRRINNTIRERKEKANRLHLVSEVGYNEY